MLQEILAAITDLPVIVQGALGSALFALCLGIGQLLVARLTYVIGRTNLKRKKSFLFEDIAKRKVMEAKKVEQKGALVTLLIYRGIYSLFKALIWLCLGLTFSSIIPVLGTIGYMGALYYLFLGLNSVRPSSNEWDDLWEELQKLKADEKKYEKA